MANSFSTKVDIKLKKKLQEDLKSQGFTLSSPPHTLFSAKKKGVICTLYESGTLLVQGKAMKEFIEFYLEPEILKEFSFSHPEIEIDFTPRIGMDEAGKGDFFGPISVASVYADGKGIETMLKIGLKDSKKLSDTSTKKLAKKIKETFSYTIIRIFPPKYNELYQKFKNLNRFLAWLHTGSLKTLSEKTGCTRAILDRFADPSLMESFMRQKNLSIDLTQKVRAEEDLVVAAASILARDSFLEGLEILGEKLGSPLPKGAGKKVEEAAQKLKALHGDAIFSSIAKIHFKTMRAL